MHDGADIETKAGPGEKMRRRILDAAAVSLAERGYEATSMRAIADTAGLKAGSIYYHFPSKDDIAVTVLNEGVDHVRAAVEDAAGALPATAGGRARLHAAIEAHLSALVAHKAYARASIRCYSMAPAAVRARTVETRRAFDRVWLDLLAQAREAGTIAADTDLKALHRIILGALNWTVERRGEDASGDTALAETLATLVCSRGR